MKGKWICTGLFIFTMFLCMKAYCVSSSPYYELLVAGFENNESLFRTADITIEETYLPPEEALMPPGSNGMFTEEFGTLQLHWIFDGGKLRSDVYEKSGNNNWKPRLLQSYDREKVILYNVLQEQAHVKSDPAKIVYDFRVLFGLRDPGGRTWSEMIQKYPTDIEKIEVGNDTLFVLTIHASDLKKIDKIWVSASKNFRVIKEEYYNLTGELRRVLEYLDFEKINDQMWLPKFARQLLLIPSENGSFVYNQKKWMRDSTRESHVISWQVNQPVSPEAFTIMLPDGVKLFDDIIGVQVK